MRIQQLAIAVANQIAAGEVIERPASVVKELLENSLDAQADSIAIDIGYGGLNQIKISDNGLGIMEEDLPLAIAAHATSKISKLSDLYSIASMGFRGEALASIASISRLSISSRPAEQAHAMMLTAVGEQIQISPCARNQGTTIDVRDLFFNAPVRKKFLKSERAEFQAIEMIVRRFALSAPAISIRLTHNGKAQLELAAAHCDKTRLARVRKLLGKRFVEQANYLDVEQSGMRLEGWVSTQDYQRSQNDKQWVYVNGRMVKDKLLNHAIKQAYEELLHPGRHPSCLLYLTIKPEEVDVNVHPTKHELRFRQPRLIHDFIRSTIQQALHIKEPLQDVYRIVEPVEEPDSQIYENQAPLFTGLTSRLDVKKPLSSNWINLNERFALSFMNEQPYLLDAISLQRHYLFSRLQQERFPLKSRPLLLPLSYELKPPQVFSASQKESLGQLGMEVDWAGEQTLLLRSIPVHVPHLEIKAFMQAFFEVLSPSDAFLLKLLVLHQSFNLNLASMEDKNNLIAYVHALQADSAALKPYCKHLSAPACSDLLNA